MEKVRKNTDIAHFDEAMAGRSSDEHDQEAEARKERVARVFREHNDALVRFIALRVCSQQEAKDIAQEAYVRLLNLDQPGAVSFLRAFLFKTAANLAVDRIRHEQVSRHVGHLTLFEEFTASSPTPEQVAGDAQELKVVEEAIDELPAKCRRAFILHRVYGLDLSDVAKQMNLSERMVRIYVVRALAYCRDKLERVRKS